MSKVEIEVPDDRWFRGEWQFEIDWKAVSAIALALAIAKIFA